MLLRFYGGFGPRRVLGHRVRAWFSRNPTEAENGIAPAYRNSTRLAAIPASDSTLKR